MKIAVFGFWHQGGVGAACPPDMGNGVLGAAPDPDRMERLAQGKAPWFEPGLDALLGKGIASGRLTFTNDPAAAVRNAPHVFVMFDTPVDENDESDLTEIFQTFKSIAKALRPDATILVTAQVPVGTCD